MTNRADEGGTLEARDGKLFAVLPAGKGKPDKRIELRETPADIHDWGWDLARLLTAPVDYMAETNTYRVGGRYLHPVHWGDPQPGASKGGAGVSSKTRTRNGK